MLLLAVLIVGRFGISGAELSSSSSASTTVFFASGLLVSGFANVSFLSSAEFWGLLSASSLPSAFSAFFVTAGKDARRSIEVPDNFLTRISMLSRGGSANSEAM